MRPDALRLFDPLLSPSDADAMRRLFEGIGAYRVYVEGQIESGLGQGLVRRHDAILNHYRAAASAGAVEPLEQMVARTNLFRATFAEHDRVHHDRITPLLHHPGFIEAGAELSGRGHIVPMMAYGNILLPGQELALHTDTPEFRGLKKAVVPEWFCVAMAHSGLFERWRIPVISAVAYFSDCDGGEFVMYTDGPDREPRRLPVRWNTAVALDADDTFHGVARVGGPETPAPPVAMNSELRFEGQGAWSLRTRDEVTRYDAAQLRFSIQWKAYCFVDDEDRRAAREHRDDLDFETAANMLYADLRKRGRLSGDDPGDTEGALMMIDEYIRFP